MAYIIPTILAQGIYTGIISTISTVTMGTCSVMGSIYTHKNPNVTKILRKLDIERRMKLIQSVLNTIDHQTKIKYNLSKPNNLEKSQIFDMINKDINLETDPIELCLLYVHESINNIHQCLIKINQKVNYHNTKWFSTWRTLNLDSLLENLKIESKLLDSRFNDLTKISIFLKNNNL